MGLFTKTVRDPRFDTRRATTQNAGPPAHRHKFDPHGDALPNPDVDRGAYLLECRKRMRAALNIFAALEKRIRELDAYHTRRVGGEERVGHIELGKDGEIGVVASKRINARERARTYALAILAEEAVTRMLGDV